MESSGEAGKTGDTVKIEKRMVVEYGIALDGVWLPLAMLRRLGAHGPWDAPFTEATADQERVLVSHSLAERHNRAGLHRGAGLPDFVDATVRADGPVREGPRRAGAARQTRAEASGMTWRDAS
jgi:hypothetical protein